LAQTSTTHTSVHHTSTTGSSAGSACSQLPPLSSKIPALPAGVPCARPLYTVTTTPPAKFDYVSPMESTGLKETLGLESTTFSLSYIDFAPGTGPVAGAHKWYTINYTGYLVDGTKFDSSLDRKEPISIPYGQHQVVVGWDTGFDGMHVGGKRRLFIPYQLGYGATAHGPIPPKSMLIFDVELLAISDAKPEPKTPPAPPASAARPLSSGAAPQSSPSATTPRPATPPPATNASPAPATPPKP
jgi:peptidylprolyl isomerase